jgi:hypothetical protein
MDKENNEKLKTLIMHAVTILKDDHPVLSRELVTCYIKAMNEFQDTRNERDAFQAKAVAFDDIAEKRMTTHRQPPSVIGPEIDFWIKKIRKED